jgi:hypothetical protein
MKLSANAIARAFGVGASLCAVGFGVTACSSKSSSSGSGFQSTGPTCTKPDSLKITFNPMHSAFIPGSNGQRFVVPAVVSGVSQADVNWSASDPSVVGFQPDGQTGGTLITVLGVPSVGTVTITATVGTDLCGSALLTVTWNTEAEWMAGAARYNNGAGLINPFAGTIVVFDGGDGGNPQALPPGAFQVTSPSAPSPFEPADGGPGPACNNCHGPIATGGIFRGIQHTPLQTAGFSDLQLIDAIVNGIIPDGGYYDPSIIPYEYWQSFHRWRDLTPEAQRGIICYLRSLAPAPQTGLVDFGGLYAGEGGAGGPVVDSGSGSPSGSDDASAPPSAPDAGVDATSE